MSYSEDRKWGDRFLPAARQIVGPRLLVPAPFEEDAREATDLMVLRANDIRVAVRIRRPGYARRFPDQFTLRYDRPSGAKTEYEKIMQGFGNLMLYGHALRGREEAGELEQWLLIDLDALRWAVASFPEVVPDPITAGDGVRFIAFDIGHLPDCVLIARSEVSNEVAA